MPTHQTPTSCVELLKVLADETRLAVVNCLMAGPRNVGQINESVQIEQSLLSHHLRVLRDSGLVVSERQGKQVCYSLAQSVKARRGSAVDLGCCRLSFP